MGQKKNKSELLLLNVFFVLIYVEGDHIQNICTSSAPSFIYAIIGISTLSIIVAILVTFSRRLLLVHFITNMDGLVVLNVMKYLLI